MVFVPDIETSFRRKARALISPMATRFDPEQWQRAHAETPDLTPGDSRLLAAALWVGREASALSATHSDRFGELLPGQAIALGVASLNAEHRGSLIHSDRERRSLPQDAPVSFDYLTHIRYENTHGQRMSAGDFIENGIESLESWIFDARRIPVGNAPAALDIAALQEGLMVFYSMRKALKNLFDEALHEGEYLDEDISDHWRPADGALADLKKAWHARAEANFMTEPVKLQTTWPDMSSADRRLHSLSRSVTNVAWTPDGWHGKVSRQSFLSRRPNAYAMERAGLRASYIGLFMDEELPLAPGLSVALLFDAWWVLADLGRCVGRSLHAAAGELTLLQAAGAVTGRELCRVLAAALRVSQERARKILEFLTHRESRSVRRRPRTEEDEEGDKGNRGLWSAPLVACPDEDVFLLPQPVFDLSNPVYRAEAWLEKGGIDDRNLEHRGDRFENHCRTELGKALADNQLLTSARFAPNGINVDTFPHQTDLLFCLGGRAFVGEIKCWLTPADPHHWDRFYRIRLKNAVEQALSRAEALRGQPEFIASALGISSEEAGRLEVCPIVVLNITAGFSLISHGCRIIDYDFLRSYLRTPLMSSAVAMKRGQATANWVETLYTTEQQASDNFDGVMADPWTLRRFLDRLEHAGVQYPRPSGGDFTVSTRFRGDLSPLEKLQYWQMIAEVEDQS